MNFKKNLKTYLKIFVLVSISLTFFVSYVLATRKTEAKGLEFKNNLDRNIKILNNEKNEINGKKIILSQYGLQNGITDTTVYIYASGTEFNDSLIYNSILSAQNIGSTSNVKVLVLFDRKNNVDLNDFIETKLFLITKNDSNKIVSSEISNLGKLDTSRPQSLYDFISFGLSNFPSKKNVLIIDGLGKGATGIAFDESSNRYLSTQDIESALGNVYYSNGTIMDLVVVNSSFGASIELSSSLHKFARYMIATPGFIKLSPLNYGRIIESVNNSVGKTPLVMSQNIYNDLFAKLDFCSINQNFKLYDLEKIKNLGVGLETIAASYFKDESEAFKIDFRNIVAQTVRLSEYTEDMSIFNFDNFSENLSKSSEEKFKSAGNQLRKDALGMVIASNTNCNDVLFNLTISLPEDSSSKVSNNIKYVGYGDIQSLKEMLRGVSLRTTEIPKDSLIIKSDSENLYAPYDDNYQYCYAGLLDKGNFYILYRSLGVISENIYKCEKARTKISNRILFKLNGKSLVGKLGKTIDGQYKVEIEGDGVRNFNFELIVNKLEYLNIGDFLDAKSQKGFYYSKRPIETGKETPITTSSLAYGISLIRERQENEYVKLVKATQSTEELYNTTYNFFSIPTNFKTAEIDLVPLSYTPQTNFISFTADFKNINSFVPVNEGTISKTRKVFTYYEYIYVNPVGLKVKTDYKDTEVQFGADVKYYKGEVLPDENIIKFWDDWYANSI
jgi:hypothetical protein